MHYDVKGLVHFIKIYGLSFLLPWALAVCALYEVGLLLSYVYSLLIMRLPGNTFLIYIDLYGRWIWFPALLGLAILLSYRKRMKLNGALKLPPPNLVIQIFGLLVAVYLLQPAPGPYSPTRRCASTVVMKDSEHVLPPIIKVSPDGLRIAEINYETCGVAGDGLNVYLDLYRKGDNEKKRPHARVLDFSDIDTLDIKWLNNQTLEVDLPIEARAGEPFVYGQFVTSGVVRGLHEGGELDTKDLLSKFEEINLIYKPINR